MRIEEPETVKDRKTAAIVIGAAAAGFLAAAALKGGFSFAGLQESLAAWYHHAAPDEVQRYFWISKQILLSPWPYAMLVFAAALEHVMPARAPEHFGASLLQDFIWFLTDTVFQAALVPLYAGLLKGFYDAHLTFLTIPGIAGLSFWPKFVLSFLVFDFLQWAHHVIRHKAAVLWAFHTVHHSQRALNLFTDQRVHPAEYLIARGLTFIPLFMFDANPFTVAGIGIFTQWYTRLYHANLRTNYGWLRFVLVTPQSHRVHHSIEPEHRDCNFGTVLSVWDRLFGTQWPESNVYPATGIEDEAFPSEQNIGPGLAVNYLKQLVYPFFKIAKDNFEARISKSETILKN